MKKMYVGNLSWSASEAELRELFEAYGTVHSAAVITDRETGRSRGFGFVEMDEAEAEQAMSKLDGSEFSGRSLRVNEAEARRRDGGGGGGGRDRW